MYHSLIDTEENFTLYAICFDDLAFQVLNSLNLPRVVSISLGEFETTALLKVKAERSKVEYCWTCTPHVIRYVIDHYNLNQVTYLDADLCFYAKPTILLEELDSANASVLITEHRYTHRYSYQIPISGIYCVQFMSFKADKRGLEVLQWWQDRCMEWCYARPEDGKFGDQKYLDDWPVRFDGIHILKHLGGGVAPWNIQQYSLEKKGDRTFINDSPLIFYHFHGYKYYRDGIHDFVLGYSLKRTVINTLYYPYSRRLLDSYNEIHKVDPSFDRGWAIRDLSFSSRMQYFKCWLRGVTNEHRVL